MARIPMGNFGNAMPQVQRTQMPQQADLSAPLNNIAQVAGQFAADQHRKEQLEQDQKDKADFVLQSSKVGADISVIDDELLVKMQSGDIDYQTAVTERQKSLEMIRGQYKDVVPKKYEHNFNNYFEQHSYQSAAKYLPIAQKADQQQAIVQLKDMTENYLKSNNASDEEVQKGLQTFAQSKGLPQAFVDEKLLQYKNQRSSNNINEFFTGYKSDNEKLAKLSTPEAIIKSHPNLTQEQAIYWSGRISTQIDQNQKAYERERKELETAAKEAVTDMRSDIETGFIPTESAIKARLELVKGTPYEKEFIQYSGALVEVQKFMRLGPDQREAYLSQERAKAQNQEQDNPQDMSWRLNLLAKTHDNMLGYEKNNSTLAYSIKTGQELTPIPTTSIIAGDPNAIAALTKNIKAVQTNNTIDGVNGSLNPFTTQQQAELKQFWNKAQPGDKLALLTNLFAASGGNANASRDMIKSIAGESGAYRLSASLGRRGLTDIAGQIVTGQDLLDKDLVKVDEKGLRAKATNYLIGVTSPGKPDFEIYLESVKANYAYLIQKAGKASDAQGNQVNKSIDEDLFHKAILNVTGGKYSTGGFWGAKSVVLRPHTVSEKSFDDQLKAFNSRNYKAYGGTERDFFLDLPLEQDPKNPYKYYFKNGTKYIMDVNDKKRKTRLSFTVR